MGDTLKNRIILILGVICALLLVAFASSCGSALKNKAARDKEMVSRLEMEEKAGKSSLEKAALEQQLKDTLKELEEEKAGLQAAKKMLVQEQMVNQSLKEELAKVTKLKESLEAQVAGKKKK